MRRPFWSCGAALVLLTVLAPRAGADDGADIEWSAPAECPDRTAFVTQLDEFLGIPVDSLDSVHIEVHVATGGDGFRLVMKLRVRDDHGERTFDGADCAELISSAAISAALSLDPSALEQDPDKRRGMDAVWDGESPPDIDLSAKPPPPVVRTRTPGPKLDVSLRVLVGVDANGMPKASSALGGMVGLQMFGVRLEGGAMYWPTQIRNDLNDSGIEVSRQVGRVALCRRFWWTHLCGLAEFGRVTFRSFGYTDIFGDPVESLHESSFDWAGGGTAGVVIPLGKALGFRLDTEIIGGGQRPNLVVPGEMPMDEPRQLYQRDLVVFRAFAGVEVVIR